MNNSPNQLHQYIEDAKTWLDKAEDEFNNSNSTRGELILSLAQAEVKHAWELSRGQFVSSDEKSFPVSRTAWLIPMAAGLCILLVGGGLFLAAKMGHPGSDIRTTNIAGLHHPVQQITPVIRVVIPERLPSATKKSTALGSVSKPVASETAPEQVALTEPTVTAQPIMGKNNAAVIEKEKAVAEAVKPSPPEAVRSTAPPVQEVAAVQERPKPALQLPVEDDLTNMATHSLKNGR